MVINYTLLTTDDLTIGRYDGTCTLSYAGKLDEVQIYSKALSGSEIVALAKKALLVDDDGVQCPNAGYTAIQPAVNDASTNTTISVCAGTYSGGVGIGLGKDDLTIRGQGPLGTVKVSGGSNGFDITGSDGVKITRLEIFGATACGVRVADPADEAEIDRSNIHDNLNGVCLEKSNGNEVERNTIKDGGLGDGVRSIPGSRIDTTAGGLNNKISRNTISSNVGRGVFVGVGGSCTGTPLSISGTEVSRNELFGNGSGSSNALVMRCVSGGKVSRNDVHNNSVPDGGIRIDEDTTGLELSRNDANNNSTNGISIDDSHGLTVERNEAKGNTNSGILVTLTNGSSFERNDGRGNTGTDLSIDSVVTNTFNRNRCDDAFPTKPAWDCN